VGGPGLAFETWVFRSKPIFEEKPRPQERNLATHAALFSTEDHGLWPTQADEKQLLFNNHRPGKRRPPLCHLDRSAAQWRDLRFSGSSLEMFFGKVMNPSVRLATWALSLMLLGVMAGRAQQDDGTGPPDGGNGMGQVFGKGSGVRGTVTASAADRFTIRTDEGETYQVFYSPNTRLMKDRQPIEAADVHVGDMLMAGGLVDAKARTVGAVLVIDIDAKEVQQARAAFGKTWVMGKVTAIHDLKITIERAGDKQTQVVAVDENTSFRKRREDVTLADVKVGDMISAQGALHADTFLATNLRIMPPHASNGVPIQ
jgi:hypothetical protein